jgi:cellulose biosynthesis protein BcsQ
MTKLDFPSCVLSFMNLKGGTGKTTIAIAIAEALSRTFGKKVVIVDCDFQCSASISLIGRRDLNAYILGRRTLDAFIVDALLADPAAKTLRACVPANHAVSEAHHLHILAASPDMPRSERLLLSHTLGRAGLEQAYADSSSFIADKFRELIGEYDIVLIDCPPGITLFSEAAIKASDALIVPTLPNEISIAAIDHLRREVDRVCPQYGFDSLLLATVVSKVRHRNAAEHYKNQLDSIQGLLDRMNSRFGIVRPYLPFCQELESTTWREFEPARKGFLDRYGRVAASIDELVMELALRAKSRIAPHAKVA